MEYIHLILVLSLASVPEEYKPPVAISRVVNTQQNTPAVINFNGQSPMGLPLSVNLAQYPRNGYLYTCIISGTTCSQGAQIPSNSLSPLPVGPTNQVLYVPNTNAVGSPIEVLTYTLTDGRGQSTPATITVNAASTAGPVASLPSPQSTPQDTDLSITLTATTPDGAAPARYNLISLPPQSTGSLYVVQPDGTRALITAPGVLPSPNLVFRPFPGYNSDFRTTQGYPTFAYSADGKYPGTPKTIGIDVTPLISTSSIYWWKPTNYLYKRKCWSTCTHSNQKYKKTQFPNSSMYLCFTF